MSCLLTYLKQSKEVLPDPRGDVSLSISSWAIVLVNHEVKEELPQQKKPANKHGQYFCIICYYSGDPVAIVCELSVATIVIL